MRSLVDPIAAGTSSPAAGPTAATLGVVSIALGVSPADILSNSRRAPAVYGRHLAMYLLNTIFRMKHTHIGRAFGRDRSTATYACRIIEELRDDPSVDGLLGACEASLVGLKELAAGPPSSRPPRRRLTCCVAREGGAQ